MHTSSNVRKIARELVVAFVHHIRDRIGLKDDDYLKLGIDEDFDSYSSLFKVIISKVLDIPVKVDMVYSNTVTMECLDVLINTISFKGYTKLLEEKNVAECVYDICLFILKKVKEEEFDGSVVYYH